ncbi:hypothetical protein [Actinomyces vulturis]|uniref:hypothetical protein n=1 Tax=Actinomyces vulturis TaxID=1857645 RepID=UPI00082F193F|nr:hypothetical protein [Actinomyces vulturis]
MKNNPLIRSRKSQLRRNRLAFIFVGLILIGAIPLLTFGSVALLSNISWPHDEPTSQPVIEETVQPTVEPSSEESPALAEKTLAYKCDEQCTVTVKAKGKSNVEIVATTTGELTNSTPGENKEGEATLTLEGKGIFEFTATADEWVEIERVK